MADPINMGKNWKQFTPDILRVHFMPAILFLPSQLGNWPGS